jgi:ketosteroid isomerase-like protein
VRSIFAEWERGDFSSADWADSEIEYVFADGPSPGTWRGLEGMAEVWRDWLGAWEDVGIEGEEYFELDDERVLVLSRYSGRGKTSGLELGQMGARAATLFQIRSGKVIRFVGYWDRERAFADLGLAAEGNAP